MARLLSVNVGLPRDIAWQRKTVHTAVWKAPVQGRRMVRWLNIDGDGQGDVVGHGGEHRAVFVYQIDSYRYSERQLGRSDFAYGQFGENFTVEGLPDDAVCVGDRFRIGAALFEVTQPRVTCYRVGIRRNEPQMAALLVAHGRPGFYFRVLEEGEVEAGDEIVRVAAGPERMTVAEVNALLYLPDHPRSELERALRIPALSAGWRDSFQALLEHMQTSEAMTGNPGLTPTAGPPPAWTGFRPLLVSRKSRESGTVTSLILDPADGQPLQAALPGQFIVLRLKPAPDAPALLRSYSLAGEPSEDRYRISVKRETHDVAGAYIDTQVQVGDLLEVSAPRGNFTLGPGEGPVILLSAGIGATPVLAMLHALAAAASPREVWWIYGARNGEEHPFAAETRALIKGLPRSRSHICYSAPGHADRPALDFDTPGRLDLRVLQERSVPRDADFYLCGPTAFMGDLTAALEAWGVAARRIHTEIFGSGPLKDTRCGRGCAPAAAPPGRARQLRATGIVWRSGLNVRWDPAWQSLLELAEACDVPVRWSCRTGVCHSCETGLVLGAVGYRPDPVDPPADGNVLICCSQPTGDIVIDL